MTSSPDFRTGNIHLAAFLLAVNASKFRGVEWGSGNGGIFVFRPAPPKSRIEGFFNNGEAPVLRLFESLKQLRTELRETRPTAKETQQADAEGDLR